MSDQRSIKTQYIIKATFKDMVRTMDANKISISDITGQAGINRKTFYQYYACRDDLFYEICDEIIERYRTALGVLDDCEGDFWPEFYRIFFEFFADQDPYVERILCHPSYYPYCSHIIAGCAQVNRDHHDVVPNMTESERALFNDYGATALFVIYRRWVELGKEIPVEEVVSFATRIVHYGMNAIDTQEA